MTSESEQKWLKKFYEGTFLVKGWNEQVRNLLREIPADEKEGVKSLLDIVGDKIGREWAKDNSVRRIDTARLKQWGDELNRARKKGPLILIDQIRSIDKEVDDILS